MMSEPDEEQQLGGVRPLAGARPDRLPRSEKTMTITAVRDQRHNWTAFSDFEPAIMAQGQSPDHAFSRLVGLLEIDFSQRPVLRSTSVSPQRVTWRFRTG